MGRGLRFPVLGVFGVLMGGLLPGLAAQSTGLPTYNAPYRAFAETERGLGVAFPGGGEVAFEGMLGFGRNTWDVRFRGGVAAGRGPTDEVVVMFGTEVRQRVITHTEDFPADGALILGAGATLGDNNNRLILPIGLSLGRRLDVEDSDVSIVPYVQPTVLLVTGDGGGSANFSLGLGGDFRLTPRFDLRVAIGLGDIDGFSVAGVWVR